MAAIPREERLSRQRNDWGDGDDEVFILANGSPQVYHDESDCGQFGRADREPEPITRNAARLRWMAPCKDCVPVQELR